MNKNKYKDLSRGVSRDMSPEAISKRLEIAGQLREVAVMLGKKLKDRSFEVDTKPK